MLQDWFRTLEAAMTLETRHRLPRHAGYKYEFIAGKAQITPEPHCRDLVLDLENCRRLAPEEWEHWTTRTLPPGDREELPGLMAAAFSGVAPFATFSDKELDAVMRDCLNHTRAGGDGELLPAACMAVLGAWGQDATLQLMGAALVTLRPEETAAGTPTPLLAWIFINPWMKRRGAGAALLSGVVSALKKMGHRTLESVICTGNHASTIWHWHMGFALGLSLREKIGRRRRQRTRKRGEADE